jgi:hypothetical protein
MYADTGPRAAISAMMSSSPRTEPYSEMVIMGYSPEGTASVIYRSRATVANHCDVEHTNTQKLLTAASGGVTVLAGVHLRADHVLGLVLLAGHIGNTSVGVDPLVRGVGVATIAAAGITAVDHDLDRGDHITDGALGRNLDAISNARHGGVGPAGAATHR